MELGRFTKTVVECVGIPDKWFYVLKNIKRMDSLPTTFREQVFMKLLEELEISMFSKQEAEEYMYTILRKLDEQDILDTAINDGIEIGHEKGLEEGREEGAQNRNIEIARGMKAKGFNVDTIAELTGLTKEEIEKL